MIHYLVITGCLFLNAIVLQLQRYLGHPSIPHSDIILTPRSRVAPSFSTNRLYSFPTFDKSSVHKQAGIPAIITYTGRAKINTDVGVFIKAAFRAYLHGVRGGRPLAVRLHPSPRRPSVKRTQLCIGEETGAHCVHHAPDGWKALTQILARLRWWRLWGRCIQ